MSQIRSKFKNNLQVWSRCLPTACGYETSYYLKYILRILDLSTIIYVMTDDKNFFQRLEYEINNMYKTIFQYELDLQITEDFL